MRIIRFACQRPLIQACCLICLLLMFATAGAAVVRQPAVAGAWYPRSAEALTRLLTELTRRADQTVVKLPAGKPLKALILPHAGYIYSGWTAAHAAKVLHPGQFDKVILMGPDHRVGFSNACISRVDAYESPLGQIALHPISARLRKASPLYRACPPQSERREHSLEAVLPFLQHFLQNFKLIPIVMGPGHAASLASFIEPHIDDRTLLVVSTDLSHQLSYSAATEKDRRTVMAIMELDATALHGCQNCACGIHPLEVLLHLADRHQWHPLLLHYANSGDTAGGKEQVVGYAAIAFFGGTHMEKKSTESQTLTPQEGQVLLRVARDTIARRLGLDTGGDEPISPPSTGPFLKQTGTFVTLEKQGQLRGCIGNLSPTCDVWEGVQENAINAAFHDPRFSPLSAEELTVVKISVSVLTEPQKLIYRDAHDLIAKLRPQVDGVILRKGVRSATFLPQVWEQLPQPDQFLSHLCLKAGLPADAWQNDRPEVSTYQVQYFEEQ